MCVLSDYELQQKMALIKGATEALARAVAAGVLVERPNGEKHYVYTPQQASRIAQCQRDRQELQATLPKLRVVN